MEALLPSEIARLVLGYLEDQKCSEAARMFLETSTHLQECRTVASKGKKFSTRVNGLTLIDIIEKLSALSAIIQERLDKIADSEHLKHCGDLLEQLKFLVEETRSQRFVVNINVPSQINQQTQDGSPILSSNKRKRRHSNSDREQCKRIIKSHVNTNEDPNLLATQAMVVDCNTIEATPLESLPGNANLSKHVEQSNNISEKGYNSGSFEHQNQCSLSKSSFADSNHATDSRDKGMGIHPFGTDVINEGCSKNGNTEKIVVEHHVGKMCTAATSTEELLAFSNTEVQTAPYDMVESESESNDEPIENLSLLTKELLNRTELQERIAENINKAILPTEMSFREENLNETANSEINTSMMFELNNAIKSIVEATESDPVFEKFLDEIIGRHMETDTSVDDDIDTKICKLATNKSQEKQSGIDTKSVNSLEHAPIEIKLPDEGGTMEIPLKQRLRSSSRQQNIRTEDEVDKVKDREKEQSALEDQNAAAILSIINANIINTKSVNDKNSVNVTTESTSVNNDTERKSQTVSNVNTNEQNAKSSLQTNNTLRMENNTTCTTNDAKLKVKKQTVKRPRPTKMKRDSEITEININNLISEQEMMAMPTLIVCSKEEINSFLTANQPHQAESAQSLASTSKSHFIPIAPKGANKIHSGAMDALYLRTVNVPQKITGLATIPNTSEESKIILHQKIQSPQRENKIHIKLHSAQKVGKCTNNSVISSLESTEGNRLNSMELITLYSSENNVRTSLSGSNVPTIGVKDSSLSESGFSPYLKYDCNKSNLGHNLSDIESVCTIESLKGITQPVNSEVEEKSVATSKKANCDIITKRTPRSLLKSRLKSHRLSLSTPRRRSNHIRALDFSTPTKMMHSNIKFRGNESNRSSPKSSKSIKPICRTSLFKSPSFSNSSTAQKLKSPTKICRPCNVPAATSSPTPKLMGGWEKYNGVGVIIGDVSPCQSISSVVSDKDKTQKSKVIKESWDADLRKCLQLNKDDNFKISEVSCTGKKELNRNKNSMSKKVKRNPRLLKNKSKEKLREKDDEINSDKQTETLQKNASTNKITNNNKSEKSVGIKLTNIFDNHTASVSSSSDIKDPPNIVHNSNVFQEISKLEVKPARNETKTIVKNTHNTNNDKSDKKVVKKYVQLRTIKTNLKNSNNDKKIDSAFIVDNTQNSDVLKMSADVSRQILPISNMMDLETPRKINNVFGIPPTPRLLSPNSNIVTPFVKVNEDSGRMRSFIHTPEFPTTPCIVLTPNHINCNTQNDLKKEKCNDCYYKPIVEQKQDSEKSLKSNFNELVENQSVLLGSEKTSIVHSASNANNNYPEAYNSAKLEITQFEVIKENLPKEEAVKELKISSNSIDPVYVNKLKTSSKDYNVTEQIIVNKSKNTHESKKLFSNTDNSNNGDTSSSKSSSSSSSSSSTSSSSSSSSPSCSSSNITNISARYTHCKQYKNAQNKIYTDTSNDSVPKSNTYAMYSVVNNAPINLRMSLAQDTLLPNLQLVSDQETNAIENKIVPVMETESSPAKLFLLDKIRDVNRCTSPKETPVKDEDLLEADISETPSSSKIGIDNLTNLSSKISALITSEDRQLGRTNPLIYESHTSNQMEKKPKIISIQHLQPRMISTLPSIKSTQHMSFVETEQRVVTVNNELVIQLEEKRRRMIAKFKDIPKSSTSRKTLGGKALLAAENKTGHFKKITQTQIKLKNKSKCKKKFSNPKIKSLLKEEIYHKNPNIHNAAISFNDNTDKIENLDKLTIECSKNEHNGIPPNDKTDTFDKKITKNCGEISSTKEQSKFIITLKKKSNTDNNISKNNINLSKEKNKRNIKESDQNLFNTNKSDTPQERLNSDAINEKIQHDQSEYSAKNSVKEIDKVKEKRDLYKIKEILKSKVDQIKRDLFSDEENDQRCQKSQKIYLKNDEIQKNKSTNIHVSNNIDNAIIEENITIEEKPKEILSCVLECLQLVPACKNDNVNKKEIKVHKNTNQDNFHGIGSTSVEYHFVYDDCASTKKRRRRFSEHELKYQINLGDHSQPVIKTIQASDYNELFNMNPKSKKKLPNRKLPLKNEKFCELNTKLISNNSALKDNYTKPLATSSPLEKPLVVKVKKIPSKLNQQDQKSNVVDVNKKIQHEKRNEIQEENIAIKSLNKKPLDYKEIKKSDKKHPITDPQTLLNNINLDEFLTSVHGPT